MVLPHPFMTKSSGAGTTITVRFPSNAAAADEPPRFATGYWSIRGLGAPLRMMLCAAKCDHTVFLYDIVENGDGWTSGYFQEKSQMIEEYSAPLMNLPFVADRAERRVVCQTNACMAHVARHVGFWGSTKAEASQCEELLCEIYDVRNTIVKFSYGGDGSKEVAEKTLAAAKKNFAKLEAVLKLERGDEGASAPVHLVGGKFSAPDFHLYEMLDQYSGLCSCYGFPSFLEDFPLLKAFKDGFEKLEENQFYLNSWLHTGLPHNNCMACFASLPGEGVYKHGESAEEAKAWKGKGEITMTAEK
uniref:glutathione transferase n=1 Tax=Pseudictyota dubia TaxID=2749911 RepID=A0A7R9Z8H7_9STRA